MASTPDIFGLTGLPEIVERHRVLNFVVRRRRVVAIADTVRVIITERHRQADAFVDPFVADDPFWIPAFAHRLHVLEQAFADHGDTAIASAQMLFTAVGDDALADPGHEILIHGMTRYPVSRAQVFDRTVPVRNT